jgi:hypothetical protein
MNEVYQACRALKCVWKQINNYRLLCIWRYQSHLPVIPSALESNHSLVSKSDDLFFSFHIYLKISFSLHRIFSNKFMKTSNNVMAASTASIIIITIIIITVTVMGLIILIIPQQQNSHILSLLLRLHLLFLLSTRSFLLIFNTMR